VSTQIRYDWERFWVDPRARSQISADDFFPDPRAEPTWLRPNVDALTLNEASTEPCLILLGEPGLGKSQAVQDAVLDWPNLRRGLSTRGSTWVFIPILARSVPR
jgi:hypothetical protein